MNATNGSLHGLSSDELRAAVRAVLRDVLPAGLSTSAGAAPGEPTGATLGGEVTVQDDADLAALVRRIATLCDDPAARAALCEGRHTFRLAGGPTASRAQAAPTPASVVRIERGAVTERAVAKAAADGARLVVGPRAVLTPLARDKARVLGVRIEKER